MSGALQVDPSSLNPELASERSGESLSSGFKTEAENALKNCVKHRHDGASFDYSAAKDQLTILKEAAPTPEIKDKLTKLADLIQHSTPQDLTKPGHLQDMITHAFASKGHSQHNPEDIRVTLNQNMPNPFKTASPFPARVPTSTKSKSADNHTKERSEKEDTDKATEAPTFWKKVKGLFH